MVPHRAVAQETESLIAVYFRNLQQLLETHRLKILLQSDVVYTSPVTGYYKGLVTFLDRSRLSVFEHVRLQGRSVVKTHYRYHYMAPAGEIVFRYDNAPHYKGLKTFPHHKHEGSKTMPSKAPVLKKVLKEIDQHIIRRMVH